jgi:hypothetical protein
MLTDDFGFQIYQLAVVLRRRFLHDLASKGIVM